MADLRRCIGSVRFGIEAHDAPVVGFPKQPSQKDGLGRMCKPHWNQYTAGLARDAKARKAAAGAATVDEVSDQGDPAGPDEAQTSALEPAPKRTPRSSGSRQAVAGVVAGHGVHDGPERADVVAHSQ
jgi:hypothetical protein